MTWLEELEGFVAAITDAPLPCVPGADVSLYQDLEAIRCRAACACCEKILNNVLEAHGQAGHVEARQQVEPIRRRLAGLYPEHSAGLLDPSTWPAPPRIQ